MNWNVALTTKHWAETNPEISKFLEVTYFNEIGSTSTWIKQQKQELLRKPILVLAENQTAGRGRAANRVWSDPGAGSNLSGTWSLPCSIAPRPPLPARIGLHLLLSVKSVWPNLAWSLKPPNDLWLCKKKMAGILIEVIQMGNEHALSVGLGMNVFSCPDLPSAIQLSSQTQVEKNDWQKFLSAWTFGLVQLSQSPASELTNHEQAELLLAIQNSETYSGLKRVNAFGNLLFDDRTIFWQEL